MLLVTYNKHKICSQSLATAHKRTETNCYKH